MIRLTSGRGCHWAVPRSTIHQTQCSGARRLLSADRFSTRFNAPVRPGVYEGRYNMLSQYLLATMALVVR